MTQASQDLSALAHCLFGTALPFACSSAALELVAISLATLEQNAKLQRWIQIPVFLHLGPLLIAPVLFANVLTTYVENQPHWLVWSQSSEFLALFGFLFHSFLCYVVLTRVFTWKVRLNRARQLTFNNSRWTVNAAIYLLELGPPLAFTLAMVFVFQESMISVPLFTGHPTVLSLARGILQASSSLRYSLLVAILLITIAGLFLILSYQAPRLVARWTLSFLARRPKSVAPFRSTSSNPFPAGASIIHFLAGLIVVLSLSIHVGVTVIVLIQLFKLCSGAQLSETGPAWESLLSPALECGALVFVVWVIIELISTTKRFNRRFRSLRSLALIPPSLIGTTGLLIVFDWRSQYVVAYGLLFLYSYLLLRFFVNDSELAPDRLILHNAKSLDLRFRRRSNIVLLSAIGGILWPALWAFYFLWIEDGVQVTILTNTRTLASLVRGLRQDKLLPTTYLGLLGCFAGWIMLSVLVWLASRLRYRYFGARLRRVLTTSVVTVIAVLAVTNRISAQSDKVFTAARVSCTQGKIVIPASGGYTPPCADVHIEEVMLEGSAGSLNIVAPEAEVEIDKLTLLRGGATLHVNGTSGRRIRELLVQSVVLQGTAATEVAQIDFDNASISRLLINGLNLKNRTRSPLPTQPVVNVFMKDSSFGETIDVHDLVSPELKLNLGGSGADSVHFEHVSTGSMKITSIQKEEASTSIEGDVKLETRAGQQPEIGLENIRVRNLHLDVDGPSGLDIALTRLKTDPQAQAELQINAEAGVVNIRVEDLALGGQFNIAGSRTPAEYKITMFAVGRALRFPNPSVGLALNVTNLSRLVLKQLDLDEFNLCGTRAQDSLRDYVDIQDVSVTGQAVVPSELMQLLSTQGSSALSRLRLLKMLQEHGLFCGSREPIGIQALYSRKQAELLAVHPVAGWMIDEMTGLGVQINKAFITFFVSVGIYLFFRALLLLLDHKLGRTRTWKWGRFVDDLAVGAFLRSTAYKHRPRIQEALDGLRLIFGWFVFMQITLCSIYLSQTTLQ